LNFESKEPRVSGLDVCVVPSESLYSFQEILPLMHEDSFFAVFNLATSYIWNLAAEGAIGVAYDVIRRSVCVCKHPCVLNFHST